MYTLLLYTFYMNCVLMSELTACLATAPAIKLVPRRPLGICDVIRTEYENTRF